MAQISFHTMSQQGRSFPGARGARGAVVGNFVTPSKHNKRH